jgi:hypothetical protein
MEKGRIEKRSGERRGQKNWEENMYKGEVRQRKNI